MVWGVQDGSCGRLVAPPPQPQLTSKRWEFTFLPFLFQVTRGLGSPVAWHTKEATPPDTPIWSLGSLINLGGSGGSEEGSFEGSGTLTRTHVHTRPFGDPRVTSVMTFYTWTHPQKKQNVP